MSKRFTLSLCVSTPPASLLLPLSLSFTCSSLMSSLHPLFMHFFISAAFLWQNLTTNCHLRSEMSLSLSLFLTLPPPVLSFLSSPCLSRSSLFSPGMQALANNPEISWREKNGKHLHTQLRQKKKKKKRTITLCNHYFLRIKWGLSISEIGHDVFCLWVEKQHKSKYVFCSMKSTIISNTI